MDEYGLAYSVSNLGPKAFQKILSSFESAERAWSGTKEEYQGLGVGRLTYEKFNAFRNSFDIKKYREKLEKEKVTFISFLDKQYPQGLKKLENPPIGLFAKGNTELLKEKFCLGIVGTRKVTHYGREVTEFFVSNLIENGVCVISGLALGVDGIAQRTAVANGGLTISVLACGVDCCLPSENYSLYCEILKNRGLIISEYPLSQHPNKGTFLARNRIIAALSNGVLVTEAAADSGSLVTAGWGFKLGKKVFAVPGPITSKMSDGSLKLLKQGARLVTTGRDILDELHIQKPNKSIQKFKNLNKDEKKIVLLLEDEELTIDELSIRANFPISKLFVLVSELELKGILKNSGGKIRVAM